MPKKNKKLQKEDLKARRTTNETLPLFAVFNHGIIESRPHMFSKSYDIRDINFKSAQTDEQDRIYKDFNEFLNSLDPNQCLQLTINNRNVNEADVIDKVKLKSKNDSLDQYRYEYNDIIIEKMKEGRNNLTCEKYFTVGIKADDLEMARNSFNSIDSNIVNQLKKITKKQVHTFTTSERLKIMHDIMNIGNENNLQLINGPSGSDEIDFKKYYSQGLSVKDIVAPNGFDFRNSASDYFTMGDKYVRTLYVQSYPNFLNTDYLADISNIPRNFVLNVFYNQMESEEANSLIRSQILNINAELLEKQKAASRNGYSTDLISPQLQEAKEEADELRRCVNGNDQKIFLVTLLITHFADSLEELNEDTKTFINTSNRFSVALRKLPFQQEGAFRSCLPLGFNEISIDRTLTTEQAAIFIPFNTKDVLQDNGMYYGLNANTKNLILFNRINSKNQNGIILGTPGSGKSFAAKREIINVYLGTNDDIFIIDPENEYTPMVEAFGGESIKLELGGKNYINPFDMDINYADSDDGNVDPIALKSDYIAILCETMLGSHYALTPQQKSVLSRCVRDLYKPYMEHMAEIQMRDPSITYDEEAAPTLDNLYRLLNEQPELDARNMALAFENYCVGTSDIFAHRTNVNTHNRLTSYNIKDIGKSMKELGLQVCLNHVWNKTISNSKRGVRTWFYIDEFHLLTRTISSISFIEEIFKRARKWGGVPTGITQNVKDLLINEETRGVIQNCDFILLLNQSPIDKMNLMQMYPQISPELSEYITNAETGTGLIYDGEDFIPFVDKFPTNTKLYKIMSTKFSDKQAQLATA